MTKVIKLINSVPEKFGPQRVRKKKEIQLEKKGQLNLFSGGKVVNFNQLTPFEEALQLDEQGELEKAIPLYEKAILQEEGISDAYCNLGIIQFKLGNSVRAIDYFTKALQKEPRHFEAHYNVANVYSEVGDFALAKFHYQVSIEMEPTFSNSYFNYGLTLAVTNQSKEAIEVLEKYKRLTSESEEDHKSVDSLIEGLRHLTS